MGLVSQRVTARRPVVGYLNRSTLLPSTRLRNISVLQVSKKSVRDKLMSEEGAASARLSKKLVQLQDDMDLPPLRCVLD